MTRITRKEVLACEAMDAKDSVRKPKAMGTDFLFPTPSFLSGAARTLDLAGQFDRYNASRTPEEEDAKALLSDLVVTGGDLEQVDFELFPGTVQTKK